VSVFDDVWGKVSAGANFFNLSANTSIFAQLDVTFGDTDGTGGRPACALAGSLVRSDSGTKPTFVLTSSTLASEP
jgi:hypothetical protein